MLPEYLLGLCARRDVRHHGFQVPGVRVIQEDLVQVCDLRECQQHSDDQMVPPWHVYDGLWGIH